MITERPVDEALKTALVTNQPLLYAHLVKFERPSRPDNVTGMVSTSKERYTYLTDASINVSFDDGTVDNFGNSNGTQVYLANKVLGIGAIQEQTRATTSNSTLVLDGNALGASYGGSGSITVNPSNSEEWDLNFAAPTNIEDILVEGFREGDKILVNGTAFNLKSFRGTSTVRVSKIDTNLSVLASTPIELRLASEEIISILLNKNSSEYASFINREVFIYRAYFDPENSNMVGTPTLLFKGIINNVSFEDSEQAIKVSWGLTSHWGDFAQVRGRVTSDASHRALDENGVPQPSSALKTVYAYDKGFNHAEISINTLSTYTVMVEKMDIKSKKGFLGIGAGVKTKKYFVPEDRHTNLDFEFNAKAIPIVYGVRTVEGIGVFADTLNTDSSTVYTVTVLSEGEIGGIYDIYINGNSLICNDKADYDARSTQTEDQTVALVCRGRADKGDALGGQILTNDEPYQYFSVDGEQVSLYSFGNYISNWNTLGYDANSWSEVAPVYSTTGIIDGETINLTSPQSIALDFFSGKPGQLASAQLCKIAYDKNFKIQNNYWTGSNTTEYWGPNHRLIDTAYVVGKFVVAEGETTIPEIKYVVRGKAIPCYNYDYSFKQYIKAAGESESNFSLGTVVSLYESGTDTLLMSNIRIIDKWTFMNPDGTSDTRFRFSETPALEYDSDGIPSITKFYMKNASNQMWTMITHNYVEIAGVVPNDISSNITGVASDGGFIRFDYSSNADMPIESDPIENSPKLQMVTSTLEELSTGNLFRGTIITGTATSTSVISRYPYAGEYGEEALRRPAGAKLASKNTIKLSASASSVDDYYKGFLLQVTRTDSTTGKQIIQIEEIIGYNGASRIATIGEVWNFVPASGDLFYITPKYADSRCSTNTAIQVLDYITSPVYGRGLDYKKDLDLPTWLETARKCDGRSKVTVISTTNTASLEIGATYSNSFGSVLVWEGTVSNKFTAKINDTDYYYVEFDNCIGKLTNKWNDWKQWKIGDLIYNSSGQLFRVEASAVISTEPTSGALGSLTLTKASGTGPSTLALHLGNGNPVQSQRKGQKISGYSLYDSDDISYWRTTGWDSHDQRYVTRHQTNLVVDTGTPISDNINSFLEHFNGILRYTSGKYSLDLEEVAGDITLEDIRTITTDDIIGRINLTDEGTRSAFNSLTAAFADPANKFEARSISFFNSDYLKIDRNVPKKGNLSVPGITNYYNTRLLADGFLNKSRYGLSINMTVRTHGLLMLAGTVIQVIYPRYDWGSPGKKFRIESITYRSDSLVDIVAKEYDDSFHLLSNIRIAPGTGATSVPGKVLLSPSSTPLSLTTTLNEYNQIILSWDPGINATPASFTEIWRSDDNNWNNASVIATIPVVPGVLNTYTDVVGPAIIEGTHLVRYYWVRRKVLGG